MSVEPGKNAVRSRGKLPRCVGMGLGKPEHSGAEFSKECQGYDRLLQVHGKLEEWAHVKWPKTGCSIPGLSF